MLKNIIKICQVFFIVMILSGCIISSAPDESAVIMNPYETRSFHVEVFPAVNEFLWYLNGEIIPDATGDTYEYGPAVEIGDHTIAVKCGSDKQSWLVHVLDNEFVGHNPCVEDVTGEFNSIYSIADGLSFWNNEQIPWPRYTQAIENNIGIDNHFQGIQRLRNGPYIVISGSNILDRTGSIFIARMASRPSSGPFGSNLGNTLLPPVEDKLIKAIDVDSGQLWHAGGMSVVGDILAVPLEDYKEDIFSKIYFYDLSNPEAPIMYDYYIDRVDGPIKAKTSAVAVTDLEDGRYLLAAWDTNVLHFYLSYSSNIEDGFDMENVVAWDKQDLVVPDDLDGSFSGQNINFIGQCDGRLYLAAFDGENGDLGPFIPYLPIINIANLYRVDFPGGDYSQKPVITLVSSRQMYSGENPIIPFLGVPSHTDFPAGAGIYIDQLGGLSIYSVPHYLSAGMIKFSEFSSDE